MFITSLDIVFVCIVVGAFAFGLRTGVASIILIRPLTDRLFNLARLDIAGHNLSYGVILNVIVIWILITNIGRIQRRTPSGLRYIWLPFLLVCAGATLYSPLQFDAIRRVADYTSYFAMFGLGFAIIKSERDAQSLLKLVVLSSILPVLYGLFETVSGIDRFGFDPSRIQSTFSHPNMLAFYLLAVIGVILFLAASERVRLAGRLRLLLALYLIPLLIVLIMTQTRSAWTGCLVLFLAYGFVHDRRVLAVVLIAAPIAFVVPEVHERIMNLTSENDYIGGSAVLLNSYAWRKLLWDNSFTYIWRQPIFGYGLHSFPYYSPEFFTPAPEGTYAHNDFIQVLFETGVVGLVAFLWMFWRASFWLFQRWRFDRGAFTAAVGIMVTYLIFSYSDNMLEYLPYQWEFWFSFGVICWCMERQRAYAGKLSRHTQFASWRRSRGTNPLTARTTTPGAARSEF